MFHKLLNAIFYANFHFFSSFLNLVFRGSSSGCRDLGMDSNPRRAMTDQTSLHRVVATKVVHRISKPAMPLVPRQQLHRKVHSSAAGFLHNHLAWSCQRQRPPFDSQGPFQGSSHNQLMVVWIRMFRDHQSPPWLGRSRWTAAHRPKSRHTVLVPLRPTPAATRVKNSSRKTLEWSFRRIFFS